MDAEEWASGLHDEGLKKQCNGNHFHSLKKDTSLLRIVAKEIIRD